MRWFWFSVLAVLVLGGASLWYLNRDSDEMQVRKTLRNLCWLSSKAEGEKNTTALMKFNAVDKVFAPECRMDFRHEFVDGGYTPEAIAAMLTRVRGMIRFGVVEYRDLEITIDTPERATASFTGTFDARMNDNSAISEVRDLECKLQKIEDRWRITDIAVRSLLEK